VLNKISSDYKALRLKEELGKRGVQLIGLIHYHTETFEACLQGHKLAGGRGVHEIRQVADFLLSG